MQAACIALVTSISLLRYLLVCAQGSCGTVSLKSAPGAVVKEGPPWYRQVKATHTGREEAHMGCGEVSAGAGDLPHLATAGSLKCKSTMTIESTCKAMGTQPAGYPRKPWI